MGRSKKTEANSPRVEVQITKDFTIGKLSRRLEHERESPRHCPMGPETSKHDDQRVDIGWIPDTANSVLDSVAHLPRHNLGPTTDYHP